MSNQVVHHDSVVLEGASALRAKSGKHANMVELLRNLGERVNAAELVSVELDQLMLDAKTKKLIISNEQLHAYYRLLWHRDNQLRERECRFFLAKTMVDCVSDGMLNKTQFNEGEKKRSLRLAKSFDYINLAVLSDIEKALHGHHHKRLRYKAVVHMTERWFNVMKVAYENHNYSAAFAIRSALDTVNYSFKVIYTRSFDASKATYDRIERELINKKAIGVVLNSAKYDVSGCLPHWGHIKGVYDTYHEQKHLKPSAPKKDQYTDQPSYQKALDDHQKASLNHQKAMNNMQQGVDMAQKNMRAALDHYTDWITNTQPGSYARDFVARMDHSDDQIKQNIRSSMSRVYRAIAQFKKDIRLEKRSTFLTDVYGGTDGVVNSELMRLLKEKGANLSVPIANAANALCQYGAIDLASWTHYLHRLTGLRLNFEQAKRIQQGKQESQEAPTTTQQMVMRLWKAKHKRMAVKLLFGSFLRKPLRLLKRVIASCRGNAVSRAKVGRPKVGQRSRVSSVRNNATQALTASDQVLAHDGVSTEQAPGVQTNTASITEEQTRDDSVRTSSSVTTERGTVVAQTHATPGRWYALWSSVLLGLGFHSQNGLDAKNVALFVCVAAGTCVLAKPYLVARTVLWGAGAVGGAMMFFRAKKPDSDSEQGHENDHLPRL